MKTKIHKHWHIITALCLVAALWCFAGVSRAFDDVEPFFAGGTGLPNVMFIFDNSDSMQDSAYFRKNGNTYRPSTYWRRGVTIDEEDGTIAEDVNGNIIYDQVKYSSDEELELPAKTHPAVPDLGTPYGTVTYIYSDSNNRLYDSNIDWNDSIFNCGNWQPAFRYRNVIIRDNNGAEQERTIYCRRRNDHYWRVTENIDYTGPQPFTYEIVNGIPGDVTYNYTGDARRVYDANFEWNSPTISSCSEWKSNYRYKKMVIISGTNEGEERLITCKSRSRKYWRVSEAFPVPCDLTTRYKIVGSPDDDRYASGGNHPDSKMYQAKQALNAFLDSNSIKSDGKYRVNMGFATYMQARIPRVRAKYYYRYTYDTPDRCRAYYWRWRDTSADFYDPNGPADGYDIDAWGTHYEDVSIGDQIDRPYYGDTDCRHHIIHYTVAEITAAPTDSLPNRYRIRLRSRVGFANEGGYKDYRWRYFDVPEGEDCPAYCSTFAYPDPYDDGSTWFRATECDAVYPPGCVAGSQASYYRTTYAETYGDYGVADPATPRYINKDTRMVTPYTGHCSIPGDDWLCPNPDPEAGNYTLIPSTKMISEGLITQAYLTDHNMVTDHDGDPATNDPCTAEQMQNGEGWVFVKDVPINADEDLGNIQSDVYDYSYFRYPGEGDEDQPHAWSYRKAYYNDDPDNNWIYRYGHSYQSKWRDDMQADPFFPADVGDEMANHEGDDHVVFINLPEYDPEDGEFFGDDVTGQNVAKIKNYISLARVPYPRDNRYDCTMMPYTSSLAVNSSIAVTGKGTPLGASLENARRYYESYKDQDQYTLGACRENYVILLTDGLETCDGDPVAAAAALNTPLVINQPTTAVKTFVIGFGLDAVSKANLDAIAQAGGCDLYHDTETGEDHYAYFANNVTDLIDALGQIFDQLGGQFTRAAPVVGYTASGYNNRIYNGYFDYPVWGGHLKARDLVKQEDHDNGLYLDKLVGEIIGPPAAWSGDCDDEAGNDADAGCEINTYGRGTVHTFAGGNRIEFSAANLAILKPLVNPDGEDINGNGTADEDADAEAVIGYTLDPGYDSGNYVGTRKADWLLGDIYHSVSVVVSEPRFHGIFCKDDNNDGIWEDQAAEYIGHGYLDFADNNSTRDHIICVGANDGMVHAINDSDGRERWAWIPNCVLGTVKGLKDGHRFSVDLTIMATDVDLNSDELDNPADDENRNWRTIIVSGLRRGGSHYFAIDVTDPDNPLALWEVTDDNMGNTWSIPAFGRINVDGVATTVAFVGGGYSTTEDVGNRIYIIRVSDGAILKEITVGNASNNVPSQLLTRKYDTDDNGDPVDYVTRGTADSDGNIIKPKLLMFTESAYFGDTNGTLWKLTGLNSLRNPADTQWTTWDPQAEILFVPEDPRPIYHRPVIGDVASGCSRRFVLFGTGDENSPTDDNSQDYYYEIEDRQYDDTGLDLDGKYGYCKNEEGYHSINRVFYHAGDAQTPCGEAWQIFTQAQIDNGLFRLTWQYGRLTDPEDPESWTAGFPPGEKVLSDSTPYRQAVYFTTYQSEGGCDMGYSYLYALTTSQSVSATPGGAPDVGGEAAL